MGDDARRTILHEGTLIKRGERVQNWKKRHMVLRGQTIYYYADYAAAKAAARAGDAKQGAKGEVPVGGADVRTLPESRFSRASVIEVAHPERRSYFLQASSANACDEWVRAIQAAGRGTQASGGAHHRPSHYPTAGGAAQYAQQPQQSHMGQFTMAGVRMAYEQDSDVPPINMARTEDERADLLRRKLAICSHMCVFPSATGEHDGEEFLRKSRALSGLTEIEAATNDAAAARNRTTKREALLEVVDFCGRHGAMLSARPELYIEIVRMVGINLFRALPKRDLLAAEEDDEDEPFMESAWPHLSIVYELLLRLVMMNEVGASVKKKAYDLRFLSRILVLFDSQDMRERDYLKTIVHRLYGKLTQRRAAMRRMFASTFQAFIFENTGDSHHHSGMCEILEILASIINGFAVPIKPEHLNMLQNTLVPLHKVQNVDRFHPQLAYCMVQFANKDPALTIPIIEGLLKFWPCCNSTKILLFLNELDELFDFVQVAQAEALFDQLVYRIKACVSSEHFQVAERTLQLWTSPSFTALFVENPTLRQRALRVLYAPLSLTIESHWNSSVQEAAQAVLHHYSEADPQLYSSLLQS